MKRLIVVLFFFGLLTQCKPSSHPNSQSNNSVQYAAHFSLENKGAFQILKVLQAYPNGPDYTYILKKAHAQLPDSLKKYPQIIVPVKNIVATSTLHLPHLEILGLSDKLVGFSNTQYISSPVFRKKIADGSLQEVGKGRHLNTEVVLLLNPDVIMAFSSGDQTGSNQSLFQDKIPLIYNADWMETNPLGRAEWIKVFGALFQKEKQADSIFKTIEKAYLKVQNELPKKDPKPMVFQGGIFGDKWFIPGGKSYAAQLIKDAGGIYMWQENPSTGSISLNFENILLKLPTANIWLNPGMVETKAQLAQENSFLKKLPVYQNNQIYTYSLTKGPTGGLLYFEQSNLHPDWVLEDLYHIFYPYEQKTYTFHFYQKLP